MLAAAPRRARPRAAMCPVTREFSDLGTVIDEVHALFEDWEREGAYDPPLDHFSFEVMKLAVHEWIANLVQHADFEARRPEIRLAVVPNGTRVRCVIEDNSEGFDFQRQLGFQSTHVRAETPPDRGRGLLMMIACTEDLTYRFRRNGRAPVGGAPAGSNGHATNGTPGADRHRLEFWVSRQHDPCLDIPF